MTGQPGPTGRPPAAENEPSEYDRMRRRVLWKMPIGLYVVGSRCGDRFNGMTCNWAMQLSMAPKLIGVGIERKAVTHELISAGGVFSLNFLDREDRALVRKFVKPVDVDLAARTLNGFAFREETTGAPILDSAAAWLDCEVRQQVETGTHTLFVGEVVGAGFQRPEDTPVLRMEDTRMSYGG